VACRVINGSIVVLLDRLLRQAVTARHNSDTTGGGMAGAVKGRSHTRTPRSISTMASQKGTLLLVVLLAPVLIAAPGARAEEEACVKTPDGSIVCGESILKQPAVQQNHHRSPPPAEKESAGKSGYTHAQLEWSKWQSKMPYTQLGRTGLRVSRLSLGSWVTFSLQLGEHQARELMVCAFDSGINFFDTAESYISGEAETIMGNVIQWGVENEVWRRSDLVISTKVYWGKRDGKIASVNDVGLSRKHVIEGITASLERLQLTYVDVAFAHRHDPRTPMEETVRAFNHLVDRGMIFYWGTSEWSAAQIQEAWAVADRLGMVGPTVEQPSYSMLERKRVEVEYLPLFTGGRGLGTTIYSPLASGVLTGKYNEGIPEGSRFTLEQYKYIKERYLNGEADWDTVVAKIDGLIAIAKRIEATPAQLAVAWCLSNPHVSTVILGASKVAQLEENLGALQVVAKLTPAVMDEIELILDNKSGEPTDFLAKALDSAFLTV